MSLFPIVVHLYNAVFFLLKFILKKVGQIWLEKNFEKIVKSKDRLIVGSGMVFFSLMLVIATLTMPTIFNTDSIFTENQSLIFIYISIFGIVFFSGAAAIMEYNDKGNL